MNPQTKSKIITLVSRITGSSLVDGADIIGLCYSQFLRRQPDEDGFGSYLRYLENGGSIETVIQDFAESDEFRRVQSELLWDAAPWISAPDIGRGLYNGLLSRARPTLKKKRVSNGKCVRGQSLPQSLNRF